MKEHIFGTDGIRGVANTGWFKPATLNKLGRIIGLILSGSKGKNVIIGRDPRASGLMIEQALTAGITSGGVNVTKCGIVSTPALAYLTKRDKHNLGIMISASHNPADDNGIKLFAANGFKVNRKTELVIENYLLDDKFRHARPAKRGAVTDNPAEIETYINDTLQNIFGLRSSLKGLRIVLDCANGGVSSLAPAIFSRLDAEIITLNNRPDGRNINCNCGSLYPEAVSKAVLKHKADIGFSFDGDGDRLISADAKGNIRDGDFVLAIAARYLKQYKALPHNTVVGTVMSNTGLSASLKQAGIKLVRTPVGDKYVLDKMLKRGYTLGGEPSGHIIFSDYSKNGDGIVTALVMLKIIKETGKSLLALAQCLTKYPQLLVNVRVKSKPPLDSIKPIRQKHSEIARLLGDEGRIVLRYSGTEPLARVMIEARDKKQVKSLANTMAKVIQKELG